MPGIKRAVLIGVSRLDLNYYPGENFGNGATGCDQNVENIHGVLPLHGFRPENIISFPPGRPLIADVKQSLIDQASRTKASDLLFIYYTGHATQSAAEDKTERDGQDESMCLLNGRLVDNELNDVWQNVAAGARVFMFVDACHSGTLFRVLRTRMNRLSSDAINVPRLNINLPPHWPWSFSFVYIGACDDSKETPGSFTGTALTSRFRFLQDPTRGRLSYRQLHSQLRGTTTIQGPVLHVLGPNSESMAASLTFSLSEQG